MESYSKDGKHVYRVSNNIGLNAVEYIIPFGSGFPTLIDKWIHNDNSYKVCGKDIANITFGALSFGFGEVAKYVNPGFGTGVKMFGKIIGGFLGLIPEIENEVNQKIDELLFESAEKLGYGNRNSKDSKIFDVAPSLYNRKNNEGIRITIDKFTQLRSVIVNMVFAGIDKKKISDLDADEWTLVKNRLGID